MIDPHQGKDSGIRATRSIGEPNTLRDNENQRQSEHAKQLELDPECLAEIVGYIEIHGADNQEETDPHLVELNPLLSAEISSFAQHSLHKCFVTNPLAAQEGDGKCPIEHSRLPVEKCRIAKCQGESPEHKYQQRRCCVYAVELPCYCELH